MSLLSVKISNNSSLFSIEAEKFAFLLWGESLEFSYPTFNSTSKDWKKRVLVVSHNSTGDTSKSRLKGFLLNCSLRSWIVDNLLDI
jgi:hypothetical protein